MNTKPKKYKIMHMNDSLETGGAEIMILELLRHLDVKKFTPLVCSLSKDGFLNEEFSASKIELFEVPQKPGIDFSLVFRLSKLLRDKNIDILHTHNFTAWLYGSFSTLLARNCKLVHTQHSNIRLNKLPPKIFRGVLSAISRAVICVSDQVETDMLTKGFAQKNKLITIYNGVDLPSTHHSPKEGDKIHIGIVARLAPVKNHKLLIEAFSILLKTHENIVLDILGDGPEMGNLKVQVDALKINANVKFWGEVSNAKNFMRNFDIYVLCSISEGLSISILEAMACSLPIVATNVGGNKTLVEDGLNGLLVPSENAESLANGLTTLIDNEELRKNMGNNSRLRIENNFSVGRMVDGYQKIYSGILD